MEKGVRMSTSSPKLFIEIVQQLRDLIEHERIPIGGKLPSERELVDRLEVGRSTIREALRSLELLGLIETRRGEGTFLADYRKHQLVEVLAAFILQDTKSTEDVIATRKTLEKQAILELTQNQHASIPVWREALQQLQVVKSEWLVKELMIASGNRLAFKIWLLLAEYSGNPYQKNMKPSELAIWNELLHNMSEQNVREAHRLFDDWLSIIEGEIE